AAVHRPRPRGGDLVGRARPLMFTWATNGRNPPVRSIAQAGPVEIELAPGSKVEVANGFTSGWSRGFVVVDVGDDDCRLARLSDRAELPVRIPLGQVRPEA